MNNHNIPLLGLGTWELLGQKCYDAVTIALEAGYKHIDTAQIYGNHREVGQAIKDSSISRENIFITSKLWLNDVEADKVLPAIQRALEELQLDYLDLFLIHWPSNTPISETLGEMQKAKEQGLIKNLGVSNFTINHLKDAQATGIDFINNQVELHPTLSQPELQDFCSQNNISLTAYSPLGRGKDLDIPIIRQIAQYHGTTPAQIIIRWLTSKGIITIPKATSREHIEGNLQALQLDLNSEEMEQIDNLNNNHRIVNPSFGQFDY